MKLTYAFRGSGVGVGIRWVTLQPQEAPSKNQHLNTINTFLFADASDLIAACEVGMQHNVDMFYDACITSGSQSVPRKLR